MGWAWAGSTGAPRNIAEIDMLSELKYRCTDAWVNLFGTPIL